MLFDRTTNPRFVALAAIALAAGLAGSAVAQEAPPPNAQEAPPPKPVEAQPTEQPKDSKKVVPDLGVVAGWNGDHFFLRNADGSILFIPYGFVQTDYRLYSGDGVPANTFAIRRARIGFQGKLEKYYEFAFLLDAADSSGTLLRDAYLNVRYVPEIQLTVGVMTEPFGQEAATVSVTNIDFVERGLTSLLYPAPAFAFRAPGAMIHGDLAKGFLSYWVGAFNGRGPLGLNTTNEPELIGRLRFYPFKNTGAAVLKGIAFGGAYGHGRSRGLSNELSFSTAVGDRAFTLVPQVPINGPVERYNGEFTWTLGPAALRAEYDELRQQRRALDVGYTDLPEMRARAFEVSGTLLLTGERRPENGQPTPARPFFGADGTVGTGAWEIKGRYSYLWAKADGDPANSFPNIQNSVREISVGLNWYPSALVRYAIDFNFYKVLDAATVGGQPPQMFSAILQRAQFKF